MNKLKYLPLLLACTFMQASAQKLTRYVDPFIGTGGHGHTYPGATVPFGMVQLSPDNGSEGWDWCSGYHYSDSTIAGFSHTHLSGTGCGDWIDISVMPHIAHIPDSARRYKVGFSHKDEKASPGYYNVKLANGINVSLTASERCGLHKYEFPKGNTPIVRFQLTYMINYDSATATRLYLINDTTLVGYRNSTGWAKTQNLYFAVRLSRPTSKLHIYDANTHEEINQGNQTGNRYNGEIEFTAGETVMMKVALSTVSADKAIMALSEIEGWDFDKAKNKAEEKWEKELQKITVKTADEKQKRIFYTALYHTCLAPVLYTDADGAYQNAQGNILQMKDSKQRYTVFSLWDTFRGLHPLFTITQPERNADILNSMLAFYNENGLLPVWELSTSETNCMSGYHAVPVLADAVLKNTPGLDAEAAFDAMKKTAAQNIRGTADYRTYGYSPQDKAWHSVTKTLEYAFDDWCIAQVAKKLGKQEDYNVFMQRSAAYKLLFDKSSGFIRAKNSDGSWTQPFDPYFTSTDGSKSFYEEGNAWQYTFFVPHDIRGLAAQYGSNTQFIIKLDSLFTTVPQLNGESAPPDISGLIGQYAHGNEPSHHIAYMYSYVGAPWKTQQRIRYIVDSMYHDKPDGYAGNEDCGQMSAWAVWSMTGFYPANPASGEYVFGSPVFDETTIQLPAGKKMVIRTKNNSKVNCYIQSVMLNGKPYSKTYITHGTLMEGGVLEFTMGSKPNTNYGISPVSWPSS
jgi:predicted alpha-1,2-mannosidase